MRKIKCRPVAVHLIFFDDPYSLDFFTWFKSSVRKIKCRKIKCTGNQKSSVEKSSVTWFDEPYSFDFFRSVHLIFFSLTWFYFFEIKCTERLKSSVSKFQNQVYELLEIRWGDRVKSSVEKSSVTWFDEPYSLDFFPSVHLIFSPLTWSYFLEIKCTVPLKSSVSKFWNQVRKNL